MTIKYNILKNKDQKNTKNFVLFSDENFKILNLKVFRFIKSKFNKK